MQDIPLIDMTPERLAAPGGRVAVAGELDAACKEVGFFTVPACGMAPAVIIDAYRELGSFFGQSASYKDSCRLPSGFTFAMDEYTPYGYSGLLEENAFAYMGEHGKPSDYVEKYSTGGRILVDSSDLPFGEDTQGIAFRQALKTYYRAVTELSNLLLELFTIPLALPTDFFSKRVESSNDSMRCHHYPAWGADFENTQGMGTHMDSSLITLLTHDNSGIEICTRPGAWMTPAFRSMHEVIVNVGDLLAHWTNNRYVSTPHRVVMAERPRTSIVFFKLTNEDEVVAEGNRQMDALFGR